MNTGENQQGLQSILDMTRLISITLLCLHFYYYCYQAFLGWGLTAEITNQVLKNLWKTGLFSQFHKTKLIALVFLIISLMGASGRKSEYLKVRLAITFILTGGSLYFFGYFLLFIPSGIKTCAIVYILVTVIGYLLLLTGGTLLSRVIKIKLNNQTFSILKMKPFRRKKGC